MENWTYGENPLESDPRWSGLLRKCEVEPYAKRFPNEPRTPLTVGFEIRDAVDRCVINSYDEQRHNQLVNATSFAQFQDLTEKWINDGAVWRANSIGLLSEHADTADAFESALLVQLMENWLWGNDVLARVEEQFQDLSSIPTHRDSYVANLASAHAKLAGVSFFIQTYDWKGETCEPVDYSGRIPTNYTAHESLHPHFYANPEDLALMKSHKVWPSIRHEFLRDPAGQVQGDMLHTREQGWALIEAYAAGNRTIMQDAWAMTVLERFSIAEYDHIPFPSLAFSEHGGQFPICA